MLSLSLVLVVLGSEPTVDELPAALAWAVPSAFLHMTIHEGAHVVAAAAGGGTITAFRPYPNTALGQFTWGSMNYRGADQADNWIRVAPLLGEAAWMIGAAIAYRQHPTAWLRGMLLTEMVASLADMVSWYMTSFYKTGDAYGVPGVQVSVVAIPVVAVVAGIIAFGK